MGFCIPSGFSQRLLQKYASCWLNERPGPPLSNSGPGLGPATPRRASMTQLIDITKPRIRVFADERTAAMIKAAEGAPLPPLPRSTPLLRALPLPDGLRTPAEASERPPGHSRLGRGLQALLDAHERQPDGLRNSRRSVAKALSPRGAERITTILGGPARTPRQPSPDGLKTAAQAAAKLNCSIKTLFGHVAVGALRYVAIGHGTKRPRKMFTDADIDAFIAAQTRKDVPCPSTASRARRIGTSISGGEVIALTTLRKRRRDAKPKR